MSVTAGHWNLTPSKSEKAAESAFGLSQPGDNNNESVFDDDYRELVAPQDFAPGGKYRSIVKLFMHYEGQDSSDTRYAMGTGWLIRPDVLVTAGHCAYDWSQNGGKGFGRAIEVKAYIGYNGKSTATDPTVQFRTGVRIVATDGWLKSGANRQNDVSFIKLNAPFENVKTFTFGTTPQTGNQTIGVVGYPGDKDYKGEKGAQMYEEFQKVAWNLETAGNNMLEYRINTYKGQSGSPVLTEDLKTSIGAHVYGGSGNNSASPIAGLYGNPYQSYVSIFDKQFPNSVSKNGITYTTIQTDGSESGFGDEEDFWGTLKSVVKVATPILSGVISTASPFLGPIGAPVSALAGVALGAVGKLAESGFDGPAPSTGDQPAGERAHLAERAILAEAALQAVLASDWQKLTDLKIPAAVQTAYQRSSKDSSAVVRLLGKGLTAPALHLAQESLLGQGESAFVGDRTARKLKLPKSLTDKPMSPFTTYLVRPAVRETDDEGFWQTLGSVVSVAQKGATLVSKGLDIANRLLPKTESGFASGSPDAMDEHLDTLAKRALLAEATLQVLQNAPQKTVDALDEEGFFGAITSIVQKIGPKVIKYAPMVLNTVGPIAADLLGGGKKGNPAGNGESDLTVPVKLPTRKKSMQDMILETKAALRVAA